MDQIHDIAPPPPRSGFQTLLYNPGGRWSGGGTGGGTESQVHVEVEWPGTEAEMAEQETWADPEARTGPTEQGPTRAEPMGREPNRVEQKISTAEQMEQETTRSE